MNIYPVKPHKRTILVRGNPQWVNIPESNFVIINNDIFYGIVKYNCLMGTNLGFHLNCGGWKCNIKNDQDLIHKFWNSHFPFIVKDSNVNMSLAAGIIPLTNDINKDELRKFINDNTTQDSIISLIANIEELLYRNMTIKYYITNLSVADDIKRMVHFISMGK